MTFFSTPKARNIFIARLVGLAFLAGVIGIRLADPIVVQNLRYQGFDLYQRVHPRPVTPQPVRIVDIDEESLEAFGQWPWPRTRVAEMIDQLTAMGAIAIGFDIIFAEEDRLSPAIIAADNVSLPASLRAAMETLPLNEAAMAQAMRRSRVIVGETSARHGQARGADDRQAKEIPKVGFGILGDDPRPFMRRFPSLVQNVDVISNASAGRGMFTVIPEADGIFRRVPLVMEVEERVRLALSAEVIRVATGGQSFAVRADGAGISGVAVGGVMVPTDTNGNIWPWFNPSQAARYVSAGSVLDRTAPVERIAGHMVLVGTSAVGLEDYRATPVANAMPGVEIHAQIIENIITSQYLTRPNYALGMELSIIALSGVLIIWLIPLFGGVVALGVGLLAVGGILGGSFWAFYEHRVLVDGLLPAASLFAVLILMTSANYLREEVEKRQIRGAFNQYLSPALVDQLTDNPDRLVLGGETRPLTVLFTDVRGFTGISESFKDDPQGLTKLMNRFLTSLSEAILEEDGTIDKYMGDAIMAFWNAPLDQNDHPTRTCRAALSMVQRVEELNRRERDLSKKDGQPAWIDFKIGIGVNTGDCVVGNMGSEMRFDYTALGDTVNVASRLEGQSKPYGLSIVLGDATARAVEGDFAIIEIDSIRVKGKTEPERMHALLGTRALSETNGFCSLVSRNSEMLSAYRSKQWPVAINALGAVKSLCDEHGFELDTYVALYEDRIRAFQHVPPSQDWDGVFTATEK